jgi:hypothetical protein
VENSCNLEKFRILLNKPVEEFSLLLQHGNEELIINIFCALKDENIDKVVAFIKSDEQIGNGYILDNLLQLEPLSLPIVDRFIKSGFLDEYDFIKRVDAIRNITSHILETLRKEKLKIRRNANEESSKPNNSMDLLQQVIDEIEKHSERLKNLKDTKEKNIELKELKAKILEIEDELNVKNIEEMDDKLKNYQKKKKDIDKIKEEINKSKELFTRLPKDGA